MKSNFTNFIEVEHEFLDLIQNHPDKNEILAAYNFAKDAHKDQKRYENTPYIIHPLRCSLILMTELNIQDTNLICAMLLHDVVEDSHYTLADIQQRFGDQVANYVNKLTRIKDNKETESNKSAYKRAKLLELETETSEVKLLKSLDLLDNTRSFLVLDKNFHKLPRWIEECKKSSIPFAREVNKHITQQLEDVIKHFSY